MYKDYAIIEQFTEKLTDSSLCVGMTGLFGSETVN
jgi:hypothetical protein